MIALLQRVTDASVYVNNQVFSEISSGYLIYLAIFKGDDKQDIQILVKKICNLRILPLTSKHFELSITSSTNTQQILLVSQFTLAANLEKGSRPDFFNAEIPKQAELLYNEFAEALKTEGLVVKQGVFGAYMQVKSTNDGPATFILNSRKNDV